MYIMPATPSHRTIKIVKKRCKGFEQCKDWVVGCESDPNSRHARTCIKNRLCYAHCRIYLEDNCVRKDLMGNVLPTASWEQIKNGEINVELYKADIVTYEQPEHQDVSKEIFKILSSERGMSSAEIASALSKELGANISVENVKEGIRKLGASVRRSRRSGGKGKHDVIYWFNDEGFEREIESFCRYRDEMEEHLKAGGDLFDADAPRAPRWEKDLEDHIWH